MYAEGVRSFSKHFIVTEFILSVSVYSKCRCASWKTGNYSNTHRKKKNSKHRKLFVRRTIQTKDKFYLDIESKYNRSVKTVAQINENILLAGMTGKSSNDKLLEKDMQDLCTKSWSHY